MISSMHGGGGEQQTLLLLRHLDRQKFHLTLLLENRVGSLLPMVPSDIAVRCFAAPPTRLYWPSRQFNRNAGRLRRILKEDRIDVIFDQTFAMTLVAAKAADALGIPRVSTIMSPPDRAVPLLAGRFIETKRRQLAKAYRRSTAILSVSQQSAHSASNYYALPLDRITTIASAVDVDRLRAAADPKTIRRGIVVVGRMTVEKGHEDFLDAYRTLPADVRTDCPVTFVGDGPLRRHLESICDSNELSSDVRFVGHVVDAAPSIAAAEMMVVPSRFEGLPNVVLEAMTLSTPVIATDVGGISEASPDAQRPSLELVPSGDPSALAAAITRLHRSRKLRETFARNATEVIEKHHRVQPVVDRIENSIQKALQQSRKR